MKNNDIYTKKIIEVAQKGTCTKEELHYFLPDYPTLHGSDKIFNMGNAYPKSALLYLIKGCHLIEMKYKDVTGYDFGFGSPSKTAILIEYLRKMDRKTADELYDWVASNGGNYYIKAK